jgi:hypothetical protein
MPNRGGGGTLVARRSRAARHPQRGGCAARSAPARRRGRCGELPELSLRAVAPPLQPPGSRILCRWRIRGRGGAAARSSPCHFFRGRFSAADEAVRSSSRAGPDRRPLHPPLRRAQPAACAARRDSRSLDDDLLRRLGLHFGRGCPAAGCRGRGRAPPQRRRVVSSPAGEAPAGDETGILVVQRDLLESAPPGFDP